MATYYVSSAGNDANSGLTTLLPWQTIAKVNTASTSMVAGDTVLFKRGETWSGTALRPDGSGNASSPITFGAYGSGALPVIAAGAAWTSVAIDTDIAYIRFEYIDFTGSTGANYSAAMISGHDITAYECIFRDGDYCGFQAYSVTGALQYNIVVSHCYAYDNVASGIIITSDDGTLGPSTGNVVEYCVAHDNGTTRWADHGIYCRHGATIRYNTCYANVVGGGIKVNCQATASTWFPTVYGNKSYGNFQGIICDNWDALIYNNLFYGNEWNVGLSSGSKDMVFVFNTIVNAVTVTDAADGIKVFNISQLAAGMTIENNLIIQDRAISANNVWAKTGTGDLTNLVANNTINYNVYYTDTLVATDIMLGAVAYNWTEWLALTGSPDANSTFLLTLPDLITRYTNVGLTVGSNVYGKGIAIAGITTDRFGTVRPNPPSPGYYDIASSSSPPPVGTFENLARVVSMLGTKANIEAGSAALEEIRFAVDTDTGKLGIYTGGVWDWDPGGYPVFLLEPLTSTAWDGDAYSTATATLIDLSAVFGVPAGVKAVLVRTTIRDSGSAANDCVLNLKPVGSAAAGLSHRCSGLANDAYSNGCLIVPCDANGDIAYTITASGAGTMDITLQIWGYWF